MYLIDSNVFLEVLLKRANWKDCKELFLAVENNSFSAVCSNFSISSILIYLVHSAKLKEAQNFLEYISSLENFHVINTDIQDCVEIISVVRKTGLDFDDSLQYYLAKKLNCEGIITFDSDFKKTDLKFITPIEALNR